MRSKPLEEVFKRLGRGEGLILDIHLNGHTRRLESTIRDIFGLRERSWPEARSPFYALQELGLAGSGSVWNIHFYWGYGGLVIMLENIYMKTMKTLTAQDPEVVKTLRRFQGSHSTSPEAHTREDLDQSYFSRFRA